MSAKVTVTKDGPYLVEGGVPLAHQHVVTNEKGESMEWREGAFPSSIREGAALLEPSSLGGLDRLAEAPHPRSITDDVAIGGRRRRPLRGRSRRPRPRSRG